jgi:hypothetical protein
MFKFCILHICRTVILFIYVMSHRNGIWMNRGFAYGAVMELRYASLTQACILYTTRKFSR